ncbi:MAG: SRPBCC family protein [Leptospiraceae bacterium]|nr:SRPBCC family protein [Leptospiraceae bacterium]
MEANEHARTIVNERIVPYSREQVFEAWSNPKLLAQWWGPNGFTNTFHHFEFIPGGKWHFTMHAPDGTDYENFCEFHEFTAPERISIDHIEPVHRFRLTGIFTPVSGGTSIEFRQEFASADECNRIRSFVTDANEQNLDRLEAVLQKLK